jgi:hypothetical protein
MKTQEDCFFYVGSTSQDEEERILARCLNCQKEEDGGWFWEGSKKGYSPYDVSCNVCGKFIYKYEKENTEENS